MSLDGIGVQAVIDLGAEFVAVQSGLTFNSGEFARIIVRVVKGFPDTEEFEGISDHGGVADLTIRTFRLTISDDSA